MNFASFIPARIRQTIYAALGAIVGLNSIWQFIPHEYEGRILSTLTVLGFGVALGNTGTTTPAPPEPPQEG